MKLGGLCIGRIGRWMLFAVLLMLIVVPDANAFGGWRFYVGGGPGWFRYEPVASLRQPRVSTFELQSGIEFSPFNGWGRDFLWLGFGAELSTHQQLSYSTNNHHAFNLYGRLSLPLPAVKIFYAAAGIKWVQIRTIDARRDLSTPASGMVPFVSAGLQIRLFGFTFEPNINLPMAG